MILKIMPSPRTLKKSNLFNLKFFNRSLKIFLRFIFVFFLFSKDDKKIKVIDAYAVKKFIFATVFS